MKNILVAASLLIIIQGSLVAQNGIKKTVQKVEKTANTVQQQIAIFQPYLLKAKELYGQGKMLANDVKQAANNSSSNTANYPSTDPSVSTDNAMPTDPSAMTSGLPTNVPPYQATNQEQVQSQNPESYLPINNTATVNPDASGNWGNQSNGKYGNCLDALTGTIMGMGEAEANPNTVDLMFFAPSDGQNAYYLMTPSFARNNTTATYMTQHASDGVMKWRDVNETEVALSNITIGQFDQINSNAQIANAVRNTKGYSGYYLSAGNKLDGQVFAVKAQLENREVYALVAVEKHIGTSGSNGYLKIRIKSQGIDNNRNGYPDANQYSR